MEGTAEGTEGKKTPSLQVPKSLQLYILDVV